VNGPVTVCAPRLLEMTVCVDDGLEQHAVVGSDRGHRQQPGRSRTAPTRGEVSEASSTARSSAATVVADSSRAIHERPLQ